MVCSKNKQTLIFFQHHTIVENVSINSKLANIYRFSYENN